MSLRDKQMVIYIVTAHGKMYMESKTRTHVVWTEHRSRAKVYMYSSIFQVFRTLKSQHKTAGRAEPV